MKVYDDVVKNRLVVIDITDVSTEDELYNKWSTLLTDDEQEVIGDYCAGCTSCYPIEKGTEIGLNVTGEGYDEFTMTVDEYINSFKI